MASCVPKTAISSKDAKELVSSLDWVSLQTVKRGASECALVVNGKFTEDLVKFAVYLFNTEHSATGRCIEVKNLQYNNQMNETQIDLRMTSSAQPGKDERTKTPDLTSIVNQTAGPIVEKLYQACAEHLRRLIYKFDVTLDQKFDGALLDYAEMLLNQRYSGANVFVRIDFPQGYDQSRPLDIKLAIQLLVKQP